MATTEEKKKSDGSTSLRDHGANNAPQPLLVETNDTRDSSRMIEQKIMPWRFWLFVVLSLLFVVTVGGYLPLRFQYQAILHDMRDMGSESSHMMMADDQAMMADNHAGNEASMYHEESDIREGLAINLDVAPLPVMMGSSTRFDFFVNQKPGDIPVAASDLEIEHTKLMHVIGARDDMNEFFHIHPDATSTPGTMTELYIFSKPGQYKLWSQIKKDGVIHTFGHPLVDVQGAGGRSNKEVSFGRNTIVGDYQVSLLLKEPAVKNQEQTFSFDIHTLTGQEVDVEEYLGAPMHLVIISDDLKQFIHTHPAHGSNQMHSAASFIATAQAHGEEETAPAGAQKNAQGADQTIDFAVTFPEAGLYKIFAQFRPQDIDLPADEALTASFWVRVEEKAPVRLGNWWVNLFLSLVLIVLLSWGVKKFLDPREEARQPQPSARNNPAP